MSAKVVPLKKPVPARLDPPRPWTVGEVFTRDGIDYELITAGEIEFVELDRGQGAGASQCTAADLLREAGAAVGDHVLLLRPPASSLAPAPRTAAASSTQTRSSRRGREGQRCHLK